MYHFPPIGNLYPIYPRSFQNVTTIAFHLNNADGILCNGGKQDRVNNNSSVRCIDRVYDKPGDEISTHHPSYPYQYVGCPYVRYGELPTVTVSCFWTNHVESLVGMVAPHFGRQMHCSRSPFFVPFNKRVKTIL